MRLHPFAGKSMRQPMAVIQIPTNSETSKTRTKTPMKHCYRKSYSPESSLDYERQVMLQVSESTAIERRVVPAKGCNLIKHSSGVILAFYRF